MKHSLKRFLSWMLVLCMMLSYIPTVHAASVTWEKTDQTITAERPDRSDRLVRKEESEARDPSELVRVSIVLEKPSAVQAGYATMDIGSNAAAMAYRAELKATQAQMAKMISVQVLKGRPLNVVWNMTLVGNIISAWVPYGAMDEIAAIPGIKSVSLEAQYAPAVAERNKDVAPTAYSSGGMIGSGVLWNSGYTGAGSRIAIIDTGTDTDHQSFDNGAYLYALAQNAKAKGMDLEGYKASLNLMTAESIRKVLPQLHAYQRYSGLTAEDLYLNEKLPFGFNYVDYDLNIVHDYDRQGEHGSHVAGIATANRYIPNWSGGYDDARDSVMMLGVAPDAQLITMKVFGNGSPFDSDFMVAIEDAIMLGCDAVNLSLGTTMPGSPYTDTFSELMEMMKYTDTVVTISAGNASNWPVASTFGYLYNDDVSFDTVGSPGSYASAFTVASVENEGSVGYYFSVGEKNIFYSETLGYGNTAFTGLDKSLNLKGTEYEYVLIDGLGYPEDYQGLDVSGKVVMVSRGTLNFAEKANNAAARGAVAVLVYNNEEGMFGMDLTGLGYAIPVAGILRSDAQAIMEASTKVSDIAYTGKIIAYGKMGVALNGSEYFEMSSFSSWGIPGNLTLKPEITAPGGEIYSVWGSNSITGGGSNKYETMSGTSMAAPQVTGMAALLAQVYRENGMAKKSGISARHLAQSLLMSTAEPLFEENSGGNYYSLLNQGAGLARVDLAAQADSFIKVQGQEDYKVKAELGDDPERTGTYSFNFTITNMGDTERAYTLDADLFRQDVFEYMPDSDIWLLDTWTTALEGNVTFSSANMTATAAESRDLNGDGVTDAGDADFLLEYVVGNESRLLADGDVNGDGRINSYDAHLLLAGLSGDTITVSAGKTATVRVTIELTAKAKAALDKEAPKGTYVEAFVYARGVADAEGEAGTVHSIPVLGFYGDWSEPSMYDRGTMIELASTTIDTMPYLYRIIGSYGNALGIDYGDGSEYYYGGNPILDDDIYLPERNAFNSVDASRLTEQSFTLIRGAGAARIQITNAETGEVYFQRELGELYPAYYNPSYGMWENTVQYARLNWTGSDASGEPLAEGTKVSVSMIAVPHYYRQANGSYSYENLGEGSTMTTTFTIDNTAPEISDIDMSSIDQNKLTVKALDNQYVSAVALMNAKGSKILSVLSPNQTEQGKEVAVELDLNDIYGTEFLVAVFDYAQNVTTYAVEIDLGSPERDYFTAIDYSKMTYVSVDKNGQTSPLADIDIPVEPRAAEYVGGHLFIITEDNSLFVANDENLTVTERICQLDPDRELLITGVNDMAYNYADGKLYVQFYSELNNKQAPYLATLDLRDGTLDVVCEMPVDVNTMAIDSEGNFYSAGFQSNVLYTYTLAQITGENPGMTYVGEMGYYKSSRISSMAWDHNEGRLYWAFPNTLLGINSKTAEPTLRGYHEGLLVGLYIRPAHDENLFAPVDTVERVELNLSEARIMVGASCAMEASVWPWNASDRTVTWTSSDSSVATVDAKGNIIARSLGECVITATSRLDPSKSASCSISTFKPEKTLNALIWDQEGNIFMSEFNTGTIPEFTKLHNESLDNGLASATVGQDGNIYAASLSLENLKSDLYRLDPVTYEATKIGPSSDGYVDLAPAPGAPGNSLMAVCGANVLHVNVETGDYYNWYYMFSNNLVGIAYVGTQEFKEQGYDTMIDWYFLVDRLGYVYLMGFLEQDGEYFFMEHDRLAPGGIYTTLDFEMDTGYFCSAYFDGEMLYFSAYKESRDNVTLMAIDVVGGTKACYEIGTFDNGVWPVAGLMDLGKFENHIDVIMDSDSVVTTAMPVPVEEQAGLTGTQKSKADGTLYNAVAAMSTGEVKNDLVYVDVTLSEAGTNADLTVSFDTDMLELTDVSGNTAAFAWNCEEGKITLSLADANLISETRTVARLIFRAVGDGETTVSIVTDWLGDHADGRIEEIHLAVEGEEPHVHSYTAVKTEPSCTEGGYTTYTCSCGDSYVADETPALGHDFVDGQCSRCHEKDETPRENPFVDVKEGDFFFDPVLWAVEKGITAGTSETTFSPADSCIRAQVVTFLWRAAGSPEPTSTVNPFVDVAETDFFYKAVLWAVEMGITNGVDETHFGPGDSCNRAQVVTFLWRASGSSAPTATGNPFTDVKETDFFYKAVLWAVENGITNGVEPTRFGPGEICNRAQVVTFLYRCFSDQ